MAVDTSKMVRSVVLTLSGTGETTLIAADANFRIDIMGLVITTTNAAAATLTFRDSTAGTTRLIIDYPNASLAPGTPMVISFAELPLAQLAGKNNNWTVQASVNGANFHITAQYAYGV